jgi:hypothetical protein
MQNSPAQPRSATTSPTPTTSPSRAAAAKPAGGPILASTSRRVAAASGRPSIAAQAASQPGVTPSTTDMARPRSSGGADSMRSIGVASTTVGACQE